MTDIFLNWFFCHAHDINCPHKTLTFSILGRSRKSISILHTYFRCNTFLMLHTPTVQAYACHNLLYILFRVSLVIEFLHLGGQNIQTQKVNYCILWIDLIFCWQMLDIILENNVFRKEKVSTKLSIIKVVLLN